MQTTNLKLNPQMAYDGARPLRALVVEDSKLQRTIIKTYLTDWGYQVVEAESGLQALEICAHMPPDLVVSDWMMPGMDGLEFCRRFREMQRDSYGYFILLTSKSEKQDVAQGLDCGADDFLTKPVNKVELRARLSAGERILGMERKLQDQNTVIRQTLAELTEAQEAMERDLRQARILQQSLLPPRETEIAGSRITVGLRSCGYVGGDLVGLFVPGQERVGIFNMDVSGHGITSALLTARISGYFSGQYLDQNVALQKASDDFYKILDPHKVASILNDTMLADQSNDEYFTMAFARVNLATGAACITQAGHPNPLHIHRDGRVTVLGQGGFPVGLIPDVSFDQISIKMEPGDRLFFCSDGATEAVLPNGDVLGVDGVIDLIQRVHHLRGQAFMDQIYVELLKKLPDGAALGDDVSAIMVEYRLA